MSAIPTPRVGFSQGYTLGENNWNLGYDENWQVLDRIVSSDFGIFSVSGRVLVLLGGAISAAGAQPTTATGNTTLTAAASTLTYIERTTLGAISQNTTAFNGTAVPLYTISTNATAVTAYVSYRFTGTPFSQGARVMVPSGQSISLDQGADDIPILLLRSSDIAHGMTALQPTDVYGSFQKRQASFGGLLFEGYVESGDTIGFQLQANVTDGQTTKASNVFGGILLNSQKKSGTTVGPHAANENLLAVANNGTTLFIFDADGDLHVTRHLAIGALGVAHSSSIGLTIQQGTEDSACFVMKSTDVAHGMTSVADTDVFCILAKLSPTDGGMYFLGLTDAGTTAMDFDSIIGAASGSTTKSTAGKGAFRFRADAKSGTTTAGTIGANANMVSFEDGNTTRFILDADGDSHQDVGTLWTNFDIVRDIELLNVAAAHLTAPNDPLRENFHGWLAKDRAVLEKHKLVTFNEDGHHFVNWSRMSMLLIGALRQLGTQVEHMRGQLNLPEHPSLKCLPSV